MSFYICTNDLTRLRATTTPAGQAVLECPRCLRCVDKQLARYAEYACKRVVPVEEQVRWLGAKVFVPSSDVRNQGRGYLVDAETLECSCSKADCRHVAKAKRFLKSLDMVAV